MADRHIEQPKTCNECRCRNCDPITAMAERVDAYKTATSLLAQGDWAEEDKPSVRETMTLADWLYYGNENNGD